jgi:hypothetical protein
VGAAAAAGQPLKLFGGGGGAQSAVGVGERQGQRSALGRAQPQRALVAAARRLGLAEADVLETVQQALRRPTTAPHG